MVTTAIRVLDAIERMSNKMGYCPSYEEIADDIDVAHSTVAHHVKVLQIDGYLDREPGQRRAIRVTEEGKEFLGLLRSRELL